MSISESLLTCVLSFGKRSLTRKGGLAIRMTPMMRRRMTKTRYSPQCSLRTTWEKIMTKIGEQKMIVAASPTGSRANPIKMQVTVRHPISPKIVGKYNYFILFIGTIFILHPERQASFVMWGSASWSRGSDPAIWPLCQETVTVYLCIFLGKFN